MFATTDTTGANTTADGLPTFTTTPVRVPMLGAGCRDIELRINTITSVAGFVAVELRTADRDLPGYGLASSNQIKGNFIGTEPQSSCRSVPTMGLTEHHCGSRPSRVVGRSCRQDLQALAAHFRWARADDASRAASGGALLSHLPVHCLNRCRPLEID